MVLGYPRIKENEEHEKMAEPQFYSERDAWVTRFYLTLALSYSTEKFWWLNRAFRPCLAIKKKSYAMKKKRQQQQLQKRLGWNPVNAATNGPWKSIRIDGRKSISLTCTSHSRSFTPPINTVRPNRRKNKQTNQQTAATNRLTAEGTVT